MCVYICLDIYLYMCIYIMEHFYRPTGEKYQAGSFSGSAQCTNILYLKWYILSRSHRLVCVLLIWLCQGSKLNTNFSKKSEIMLSEDPPGPEAGAFEAHTETGTLSLTRRVSSGWVPPVKAIPLWGTASCARGLSPVILPPIWAHLLRKPAGTSHGERGISQWQTQGIMRLSTAGPCQGRPPRRALKASAPAPRPGTSAPGVAPEVLCFAMAGGCLGFSGFCGGVSLMLGTGLGYLGWMSLQRSNTHSKGQTTKISMIVIYHNHIQNHKQQRFPQIHQRHCTSL